MNALKNLKKKSFDNILAQTKWRKRCKLQLLSEERGMFSQHDYGIFSDVNWRHHDLCGGYI